MSDLKALILAGGQSSRMGQPKHLLELNGQPNYIRLLSQIRLACPKIPVFLSLKDGITIPPIQDMEIVDHDKPPLRFIFDQDNNIGPAAGLIAAYNMDSDCHWLVVACDFPLLQSTDLRQLIDNYEDPVTCFQNHEGWTEPLSAIWSPAALSILEENVRAGKTGPNNVVKLLKGKSIRPHSQEALFNANTPDEWETAKKLAQSG